MKADRDKVSRSIRIARGQLDGVLKMIEEDRYCVDISNQLLATIAILRKTNQEIMHAHISSDEPNEKLEEALNLMDRMIQN